MRQSFPVLAVVAFSALLSSCASPPQQTGESITVFARFDIAPGREAEAEALFSKAVAFVRNAEPATTYRLYHSSKYPTVFVFYEVYANSAAADYHSKVTLPAMAKEYGPPPEGLLSRPPDISRFSEIAK